MPTPVAAFNSFSSRPTRLPGTRKDDELKEENKIGQLRLLTALAAVMVATFVVGSAAGRNVGTSWSGRQSSAEARKTVVAGGGTSCPGEC